MGSKRSSYLFLLPNVRAGPLAPKIFLPSMTAAAAVAFDPALSSGPDTFFLGACLLVFRGAALIQSREHVNREKRF